MVIKRTVTRNLHRRRIVGSLELRVADEGERFVNGLSPGFSTTGEIYEGRSREPDRSGAIGEDIARAFPKLKLFTELHLSDPDGVPMHAEANGWYWYAGSRDDLRDAVISSGGYTGFDGIYAHQLAERELPDDDDGRRRYCYQVACGLLRVDGIPEMPGLDAPDDIEALSAAADLRERASRAATSGVDVRDYSAIREAQRQANVLERDARKLERAVIEQTYANARAAFAAFVDAQRERWAREAAEARTLLESLPVDEG